MLIINSIEELFKNKKLIKTLCTLNEIPYDDFVEHGFKSYHYSKFKKIITFTKEFDESYKEYTEKQGNRRCWHKQVEITSEFKIKRLCKSLYGKGFIDAANLISGRIFQK